jgi:hypothetical protein
MNKTRLQGLFLCEDPAGCVVFEVLSGMFPSKVTQRDVETFWHHTGRMASEKSIDEAGLSTGINGTLARTEAQHKNRTTKL